MAVTTAIEACMSNHFYTFDGFIYIQTGGGAIGSVLTEGVARGVMSIWDILLLMTVIQAGIYMDLYKRYIDNQINVLPPILSGWYFNTNSMKMEYDQQKAIRTAKVLKLIS